MNKQFNEKLLKAALEAGFTMAEVYAVASESFSVSAFEGEIDSYSVNTKGGLSFRGMWNGKMGYAFTQAEDDDAIAMLLAKAKESASAIETDDVQFMHDGSGEYRDASSAFCPALEEVTPAQKIEMALALEKHAKSLDPRVVKVAYNGVRTSCGQTSIRNTLGLDVAGKGNYFMLHVSVLLMDNGKPYVGGGHALGHDLTGVDLAAVAKKAVDNAAANVGATSIPSGKYPVVLRNDVLCSLMSTFSPVFSAETAQKGLSLLADKEGEMVAAPCVTLRDDPFHGDGMWAQSFDDEGVPAFGKNIIENGRLTTLLHNLKTAHKQGVKTTANASKAGYASPVTVSPSVMVLTPGQLSYDELLAQMGEGVIITDLAGMHAGANAVSGDFSLSAKGFYSKHGKVAHAVEQITLAGNFFQLLKNIRTIGSDAELSPEGAIYVMPSVLVDGLSIAGK